MYCEHFLHGDGNCKRCKSCLAAGRRGRDDMSDVMLCMSGHSVLLMMRQLGLDMMCSGFLDALARFVAHFEYAYIYTED